MLGGFTIFQAKNAVVRDCEGIDFKWLLRDRARAVSPINSEIERTPKPC